MEETATIEACCWLAVYIIHGWRFAVLSVSADRSWWLRSFFFGVDNNNSDYYYYRMGQQQRNSLGLLRLGLGLDKTKVLVVAIMILSSVRAASGSANLLRRQRQLQSNSLFFRSPTCEPTSPCVPWTSVFGAAATFTDRVIVDCSVCVTMEDPHLPQMLRFDDGIEIRGRLVVPDGTAPVAITTTFLVVQGRLDMTATQAVTETPSISITMVGDDPNGQTFGFPDDPAQCSLDASGCRTGPKGIVVAGGTVRSKKKTCFAATLCLAYHCCSSSPRIAAGCTDVGAIARCDGRQLQPPTNGDCLRQRRQFLVHRG